MKIYIATTWENKESAHELIVDVEKLGYFVPYDWTTLPINNMTGEAIPNSNNELLKMMQEAAEEDFRQLQAADCLIVLMDGMSSFEPVVSILFGAALFSGRPIILLGHAYNKHPRSDDLCNRFFLHPNVTAWIERDALEETLITVEKEVDLLNSMIEEALGDAGEGDDCATKQGRGDTSSGSGVSASLRRCIFAI